MSCLLNREVFERVHIRAALNRGFKVRYLSISDSVQKCQAERFECDNKKCLSPVFVCDGEDDCGDRSDEKNCSASRSFCFSFLSFFLRFWLLLYTVSCTSNIPKLSCVCGLLVLLSVEPIKL